MRNRGVQPIQITVWAERPLPIDDSYAREPPDRGGPVVEQECLARAKSIAEDENMNNIAPVAHR